MANIHTSNNFQRFFPFFITRGLHVQYRQFLESGLGLIYKGIPWEEMIRGLKLKQYKKGRKAIFSPQGKIALMVLKSYTGLSDKKLIEHLNGSMYCQFFCSLRLKPGQQITNHKIVSAIRCELAQGIDFEEIQKSIAKYWKPYIKKKHRVLMDATVYEVALRYPTDTKLLFEAVECIRKTIKKFCNQIGLKLPRTRYKKWEVRVKAHQRKRRKKPQETKKINKGFLRLLKKHIGILEQIEKIKRIPNRELKNKKMSLKDAPQSINNKISNPNFSKKYYTIKETIQTIYSQQHKLITTGEYPKKRIISVRQPHLRPIKRGKEIKNIEIGAKVNKIQIDGINYIDFASFKPFNEANRLIPSVELAQKLTGTKIKEVGADAIYATNKNRKWLAQEKIEHGFPPKGPKPKDYDQSKKRKREINKERSTSLEGSFGSEKRDYNLRRINARTPKTQLLCIFFGIHTKNALAIGKRMSIPP